MKLQALVCCAILLYWAAPALAASATVTAIKGDVRIVATNGKERSASVGLKVESGNQIRTGKDSSAEIKFENGSVLRVRPNTAMRLSGSKRQKKKKAAVAG